MPRRLPTRVCDCRGRLVHGFPPGAPQPEAQVHVLDVHEIPLIEPSHALPSTPWQQHVGARHPIHDGRLVARSCHRRGTDGWPDWPTTRSREARGPQPLLCWERIDDSDTRCRRRRAYEAPHSPRLLLSEPLSRRARSAPGAICASGFRMSTHGAEPCCSPWFTAAAKPRFESFTMTAEHRCRAVPTLLSDERLSTTTTHAEMPCWLVSESMQVGRSAALL
jgi:hypothetical protein